MRRADNHDGGLKNIFILRDMRLAELLEKLCTALEKQKEIP